MRFSWIRAAMIAAIVGFAPFQIAHGQLYATGSNVFLKYVSAVVVGRTEGFLLEPNLYLFPSRWGINLRFETTLFIGGRPRPLPRSVTTVSCSVCDRATSPGASFASQSEAGNVFSFSATLEEWANGFRVLGDNLYDYPSRLLDYARYSPVATENAGGVQAFFLTKLAAPDGNYTHELRIAPLGFGADVPQMILRTGGLAMAPSLPVSTVPEPSTLVLLASGLALLGFRGTSRRRRLR